MSQRRPLIFVIVAAGVIGAAILTLVLFQAFGSEEDSPRASESVEPPSPTGSPDGAGQDTVGQTSAQALGTVIFEHDFSSPEDGFLGGQPSETSSNEYGSRVATYTDQGTLLVRAVAFADQGYVGGTNTEEIVAAGRTLEDLGDVSVEADVTPVAADDGAAWGLACRRDRVTGRFYFGFLSVVDGAPEAGIVRQDAPGEAWVELARTAEVPGTVGFGATNRLRLDCVGSSIALSVDGQKLVEVKDSTYSSGSLALFANPFRTGGPANPSLDVEFDDFVLREVEAGG